MLLKILATRTVMEEAKKLFICWFAIEAGSELGKQIFRTIGRDIIAPSIRKVMGADEHEDDEDELDEDESDCEES